MKEFNPTGKVHTNCEIDFLIKEAVAAKEGVLSKSGVLTVKTGKYTGRSPHDRYIVDLPSLRKQINWGAANIPISESVFERLYNNVIDYLEHQSQVFVHLGMAGADDEFAVPTRVTTEFAYHSLFARNMLRARSNKAIEKNELRVYCAPSVKADPRKDGTNSQSFIILHLTKKIVIIGGTSYAGEIKKSIFSFLNYFFPKNHALPMHCSANMGTDGTTALFFGLSGTGKTTLSADPTRQLIGDDEHVWCKNGIFNIEGGCYAKCINLSHESEPQIWDAIRYGAICENVVLKKGGSFDFADDRYTPNTRASYPLTHIANALLDGKGIHPKNVIFLTADAFGVMPPVAKLSCNQALYHFTSGYTSKLAGTERGVKEPLATFSLFFGEPFMPAMPKSYTDLLLQNLKKHKPDVYLVNTGWTGGPYGIGKRISIRATRCIVQEILEGSIARASYRHDAIFNLSVPKSVNGVPAKLLNPEALWGNREAYRQKAHELASLFWENFKRFPNIPKEIRDSGPKPH